MKAPNIIYYGHVKDGSFSCAQRKMGDKWFDARPEGYTMNWNRFRAAWGVFIGKYDALLWEGDQ